MPSGITTSNTDRWDELRARIEQISHAAQGRVGVTATVLETYIEFMQSLTAISLQGLSLLYMVWKMVDHRGHHSLFVPPLIQDHIQGVLSARVVLVMYGDYECFQSVNAYRLIKAAQQQLSSSFEENDVCFIFRHFPQIQIHPHAQRAAEAAAMQGQFWQMHELLFTHQQALENGYLVEYANRLGLAISRFLQNLSKGELGEFIGDTAPILAQFLEESRPTLTVIGVSSLASPEILVEIEATVAFQPVQP